MRTRRQYFRSRNSSLFSSLLRSRAHLVAACVPLLAISACETSQSSKPQVSGTSALTQSGPTRLRPIIMISGSLTDPFYAAFKKGAEDASAALHVGLQYETESDPNNETESAYVQLLDAAITAKPSALLFSDLYPSADDPILKHAAAAGLPIVENNTGAARWRQNGAIAYIGQDETLAGQAAGRAEAAAGVKNGLCVQQWISNPALTERCQGYLSAMHAAGRRATTFVEPGQDGASDAATTSDIVGILRSHSNIDGIFTLGSGYALDALRAAQEAGRSIKVGTTDISTEVLSDVKSGRLLFTIDQQPYLQGYYSVMIAVDYVRYGLAPVGQITTGPLLVTPKNVAVVQRVNQEHPGIRGAA